MFKNLPLFIGLRYTRSKRREGFVSFISGFSLFAMALGVMALILVLSVMNGFDREIKSRLLQVVPHITGTPLGGVSAAEIANLRGQLLSSDSPVISVTPLAQSFVMLSFESQQTGVMMQAMDSDWPSASKLKDHMISGYVEQLQPGEFGIILGSQVARKLGAFIGDKVQLTVPKVTVTPAGIFPRIKSFVVTGVFKVGAQVDASLSFVHQQDARKLLQLGDRFQGVQIQVDDAYQADSWLSNNSHILPAANWRTWTQSMGTLFQAMRMEKLVVSLLLSVIVAVAAFNIVASLVLMVADKRKDIAVVRTLGAPSSLVIKVFMVQGMAVGLMGIFVGTVLGCVLAYFIGDIVSFIESVLGFYLFDPSVYLITALPSKLVFADMAKVVASATAISFLATVYPAWRAGQVLPAEALRYDQ
ncbi:lipoprotein-releasing ABC transporter permease subunit [Porticoccaceae bacterium]|nr:lipoprotein-releasing ABC transporter permease subunit [Porticoccaceae bacterium]MDC0134113.1 lipoprotein-releasing ABC transporter permease subunit [Porticoccaceae bacterium]MDC1476550.1 lipoprotein-releasing ABC transporter permease subunit [Porticoccaceae bacterium]